MYKMLTFLNLTLFLKKKTLLYPIPVLVRYLHHEDQLVIGQIVIADGNPTDVVTQRRLDDHLPGQVQVVERLLHVLDNLEKEILLDDFRNI